MSDYTTPLKRCTKCGVEKPATTEFFHKNKECKNGLSPTCKTCAIEHSRQWRQNNREKHRQYSRQWSMDNPQQKLNSSLRWQQTNPEKKRAINQRYKQANPEQVRKSNRSWRQANKDKCRATIHSRKARVRSLPATFTQRQWVTCLEWWNHCCAYCGAQQSFWHTIEQDHFIPITSGGGYTASNIVPCCKSCNSSKNDKRAEQWLVEKLGKRKSRAILERIGVYFRSLPEG